MDRESAGAVVSRHKCLIYDGNPLEQLPIVVPFLADALKRSRRAVYLGPPEMIAMVGSGLTLWGVDTTQEIRRDALLLSSNRSYLGGGRFDPAEMVDTIRRLVAKALADGFQGVAASGDMMWELGSEQNFSRLLEYEWRLDELFSELPLEGLCQYRRGAVPSGSLRHALLTHRSAYIGTALCKVNPFYLPPQRAAAPAGPGALYEDGMLTHVLHAEGTEPIAESDQLRAMFCAAGEEDHRS
jgi:hypothetical protein